tara:strand:- start:318 stop:665 length:348 start_codon:yes stop_codon:yes gene_type:complete
MEKEIKNNILKENFIKFMKIMMPFTPHISNECLEKLNCKTTDFWPEIKSGKLKEIKIAVQINGRTRDVFEIKLDAEKEEITKQIKKKSQAKKYLEGKKITKTIFVKNKIINYIVA